MVNSYLIPFIVVGSIIALVFAYGVFSRIMGCLTTVIDASIPKPDIEMGTIERFIGNIAREKPIRFSTQQLIQFTRDYSTKLGSGGFGVVFKGEFPDGTSVAVKVLRQTFDKRAEEEFMAEVGTISRTYHINLVRLYGFCYDETTKALVYECMERGSLDRVLFDKNRTIEWGKLHEIAIGTAKGIAYLHEECQQKIIHYDIKPGNVLLDAEFKPKVADFGLARLLNSGDTRMTLSRMRGTPGYAAPELWLPYPVTTKCDVYSFGILLFEILGRRRNTEFDVNESQEWFPRWVWDKFEKGEVNDVIRCCGIGEEEREKAERMSMVALWCAQYQAAARPRMSTVVKMLEGEVEVVAPANPFQHLMSAGNLTGWSESGEKDDDPLVLVARKRESALPHGEIQSERTD